MIRNSKNNTESADNAHGIKLRHIFFCLLMILALLSLVSYSPQDWNALNGGIAVPPANWIGSLGARFSHFLLISLGFAGYVAVLLLLLRSIRMFFSGSGSVKSFLTGMLLVTCGAMLLFALSPETFASIARPFGLGRSEEPLLVISGGVIGQFFAAPPYKELPAGIMTHFLGGIGTMVVGWVLVISGGVILFVSDWYDLSRKFISSSGSVADAGAGALGNFLRERRSRMEEEQDFEEAEEDEEEEEENIPLCSGKSSAAAVMEPEVEEKNSKPRSRLSDLLRFSEDEQLEAEQKNSDSDELPLDIPDTEINEAPTAAPAAEPIAERPVKETPDVSTKVVREGVELRGEYGEYVVPPITMLAEGANVVGENQEAVERAQVIIQRTLEEFGVEGNVSGYVSGPRVTRYEITLNPGVSVKKVEQIQDNIAMALAAESLRVLAPIPGRSVVGIEVSNSKPEAVFMRSVMQSDAWKNSKAEIPLALGKDVSGKPVILDLAKAPHMLVAGATGTGKSVCSNSLIISMLLKFRPDELRLILVDPKIVEFAAYKTLPHLLTPIINDSAKVPIALRWAASEMDKRYQILARANVKKLSEYNAQPEVNRQLVDDDGKPFPEKMPLLVIIVDELADLMMTEAKKDVETNISRIAAKGRAAGIHIIVATQRPDVKVVTGTIKANLPTRLCFQVRSLMDSRVVLDTPGADKLLGKGDMLFMSTTSMNIERVQGAWVKDEDIIKIVQFISEQAPQRFNDQVVAENDESAEIDEEDYEKFDDEDVEDIAPILNKYLRPGDDTTMRRALEVVILDRKASTSYLQRRLRIGYNKAAELIEKMEERGIVGPPSGSGNKRDILVFDGMDIG